jgi:hypothetical protein
MEEVVQAAQKAVDCSSAPAGKVAVTGHRIVTLRALFWALLLSTAAAFLCHWHDGHMLASYAPLRPSLTLHNYFPPLAVGLLFFFLLLGNSLLFRIHRRLALETGELALIMALSLLAAPLPRYFVQKQLGTIGYLPVQFDERRAIIADMVKANPYSFLGKNGDFHSPLNPGNAFLTLEQSRTFDGTLPGHRPGSLVNLLDIPWRAWVKPALFWAPMLGMFLVFSISLGYMLYRQWAHRELLPFPLAEYAATLVDRRGGRALPDVFYNPLFWIGVVAMVVIFSGRGIANYVENMISVPTSFNYMVLADKISFLKDSREGYSLLRGTIYFAVVAVAYLLPSEISLTAWVSWPVMVIATFLYYNQTGNRFNEGHNTMFLLGCWWGMAILIIYAGRWYFWNLFAAAVGRRPGAGVDTQSVWVARVFLLSLFGLIAIFHGLYDLPLDISVLFMLGFVAMFLVLCRLVTAMGIPWIPLPDMGPMQMLLNVVGIGGVGARVFSQLVVYQNFIMPVNGATILPMTPAVANAAHVESRLTGRNSSIKVIVPFLLIMLAVSVAAVLWMGYSYEGQDDDVAIAGGWDKAPMLQGYIRKAVDDPEAMRQAVVKRLDWRQRWGGIQMPQEFPVMCGVGLVLVLVTGYLQIRLPRFPFHPLPLVLLGTWAMSRYWWSFLIGWAVKRMVLKIGGYRLFDQLRPLFTGIIVGLAATVVIWVVVHTVVYQHMEMPPTREWLPFMGNLFAAD